MAMSLPSGSGNGVNIPPVIGNTYHAPDPNGQWQLNCADLSTDPSVAVILHAMTKQGRDGVNCQDVSQSAQGRDKSRRTYQSLWSVLRLMSFVQGPVEESRSG